MTRISSITLAATIALGAASAAFGQSATQVQNQDTTPMTAPPAAAPVQVTPAPAAPTPAPIVVETKVDLRSGGPQSPESAYDARKEAQGALAEAKAACRQEATKQARNDCLRQAQADANALLSGANAR